MTKDAVDGYPDWDLLANWVAVVESGAVSAAARRLRVSQAAVSQRVQRLELMMKTSLLDRGTRPARPTPAGQRLYESALDLLRRADGMVENVRTISRAKRSIVRIGCVDSFAATVGPLLFKGLSSGTQQVRLWSGIAPALESQLDNRELDLIVTTSEGTRQGAVRRSQLFSEEFLVVLPKACELPAGASLTNIGSTLPLIRYSSRSLIGQQIDAYLDRAGEALERTCEFDATDPLLSLVAAGLGFAVSTPLCVWQSRHFAPDVRLLPLSTLRSAGKPYPALTRSFHLAYRAGELGPLPGEVVRLIRVAMERQIAREIAHTLQLPRQSVWRPSPAAT